MYIKIGTVKERITSFFQKGVVLHLNHYHFIYCTVEVGKAPEKSLFEF